ncbi:uncharacterized protein LOC112092750 [Morus notabilis]|uniref:uncharacterized protein LOC112092750 n=1 Tax=Morus notabilis TaxID=981085 RepID=UPI000CED48FA|nr:uncharacterized protein LOC112092750 [Morus notabilis]
MANPEGEINGNNQPLNNPPVVNQPMALRDYALPPTGVQLVIRKPAIQANNFELKSVMLQMIQAIQFNGLPNEDPNAHIINFLEICDTVKYNGVNDEALRLRLFPFSLRDKAKSWLNSLPPNSITSWEDLVQKFLSKFFPPAKTVKMCIEINNFAQYEGETLYEAWERYKELMRRCLHHGLPKWMQVHNFYNGLSGTTRTLIDVSAGGALMKKTEDEAYELLEDMATNNYQWPSERSIPKKIAGLHEVEAITNLTAQIASLSKLTEYSIDSQCHPNILSSPEQSNPPQEERVNLEDAIAQLATSHMQFMNETRTNFQNQSAQIRSLEVQIGQLASMLNDRQQGNLPSTTVVNPTEQCKAITLRSGKELNTLPEPKKSSKSSEEASSPKDTQSLEKSGEIPTAQQPLLVEPSRRIPFPQRLRKSKLDKQFSKFLDIFKKLHINIPFAEALEQMPSYVKFMKDLLSNKRKLEDYETVTLTEECSAILQRKLPQKLKDPRSFTIPCSIGNSIFEKALCDLGASINLMSLSIFKKLGLSLMCKRVNFA